MSGLMQMIGQFFGGAQNVQWAPWVRSQAGDTSSIAQANNPAFDRTSAEAAGRGSTILTGAGGLGAASLQKKQTLGA